MGKAEAMRVMHRGKYTRWARAAFRIRYSPSTRKVGMSHTPLGRESTRWDKAKLTIRYCKLAQWVGSTHTTLRGRSPRW